MKLISKYVLVVGVMSALLVSCSTSKKADKSGASRGKKSDSHLSANDKMNFERAFYDASKEKMLNNFIESANLYRKCLQIDPSSAAANYELANLLFVKGQYADAELYSRTAALLQPQNEWYQILYADALTRNKKYSDALKVREKLAEAFPDRIDFLYDLANGYLSMNKYDDAIRVYNNIEKDAGVMEDVITQKEKIYLRQNKFDKAVAEVKKLIDSDPAEPRYYGMLAELYQANGMNDKALETFETAKKIDPKNPYVHLALSNYYAQSKEAAKAFDEMKIAFDNPDLDIDTKIKVLLGYYSMGQTSDTAKKEGYELLDLVEKNHPTEAKTFSIYGDFLYRDKKLAEAKEKYTKAVALDKNRIAIWTQLLIIESQLNDYASMAKDSKEAMELFPSEPTVYFFSGVAQLQLNDYKQAIATFKKGIDLVVENKPLEGQLYANLGDAYYRDKQMEKSDSAYEKALEINPKDTYVLNNYSYYLSLRNVKLDRAEAMSRKANEIEPNNGNSQDTYAWILYASAKYGEAKEWIEKAIANGGEKNAVILEHYGDILFKLNEKNKALEYWIKAKQAGKGSDFLEKKISEKTLFE